MTLANSSTQIYCQTCACAWDLIDATDQFYFRSASLAIGSYSSPADIVALGEQMTFCPQCDVEELAIAYRKPAEGIQESPFYRRDSRLIGANVDKGGAVRGNADVVHGPQEDPT